MKERRYDIDWLRVVATLAVFCVHCMGFFTPFDWHLKNAERSDILIVPTAWLDLWMMPLFFLLSGFASWYSLKSRSGGRYLFERVKRLLIPFYTVGVFIIIPPQAYIHRVAHTGYAPSILKLIPSYYPGSSLRFSFSAPHLTNLWLGHLWFFQYLFNVSLLTLPLLLYLRSEPGQRLIERVVGWCDRPGGIFLFLVPLVLVRIGLRSRFPGEHTWADLFYYAAFFLIGYATVADERLTEGYKRHGWSCLALGIAALVAELVLMLEFDYPYPGVETFSGMYVLFQIIMSIANLCWVVFFLSIAARHMNFGHKVLPYGNEAVLPFYILHQTVILAVGWTIIPLDLSIPIKFLIISTGSFVLVIAVYELLIKRISLIRFLFGMRLRKKQLAAPVPRPGGSAAGSV